MGTDLFGARSVGRHRDATAMRNHPQVYPRVAAWPMSRRPLGALRPDTAARSVGSVLLTRPIRRVTLTPGIWPEVGDRPTVRAVPIGVRVMATTTHIQATCPGCSRTLRIRREYVGRRAQCKYCETMFTIGEDGPTPEPPAAAEAVSMYEIPTMPDPGHSTGLEDPRGGTRRVAVGGFRSEGPADRVAPRGPRRAEGPPPPRAGRTAPTARAGPRPGSRSRRGQRGRSRHPDRTNGRPWSASVTPSAASATRWPPSATASPVRRTRSKRSVTPSPPSGTGWPRNATPWPRNATPWPRNATPWLISGTSSPLTGTRWQRIAMR